MALNIERRPFSSIKIWRERRRFNNNFRPEVDVATHNWTAEELQGEENPRQVAWQRMVDSVKDGEASTALSYLEHVELPLDSEQKLQAESQLVAVALESQEKGLRELAKTNEKYETKTSEADSIHEQVEIVREFQGEFDLVEYVQTVMPEVISPDVILEPGIPIHIELLLTAPEPDLPVEEPSVHTRQP